MLHLLKYTDAVNIGGLAALVLSGWKSSLLMYKNNYNLMSARHSSAGCLYQRRQQALVETNLFAPYCPTASGQFFFFSFLSELCMNSCYHVLLCSNNVCLLPHTQGQTQRSCPGCHTLVSGTQKQIKALCFLFFSLNFLILILTWAKTRWLRTQVIITKSSTEG